MNDLIKKDEIKIENLIYEIRGMQVMLDSDLAKLYQCKNGTKTVNQAVGRHITKFPADFYFQLTEHEYLVLQSQIGTAKLSSKTRSIPYVFTEQGVAMLSTVIKTNIADEISISIMRAFVAMRHYIGDNEYRLSNVETKVLEHDNEIKLLQESFKRFDEKKKINEIYFNGQIYDAYSKILEIFKSCKKKLIIIDGYADNTILDIIKRLNVDVTIITKKNNLLTNQDIEKYNKQYSNLKVIYNNTFHDRYFIIDESVIYHCGASINRIGYKTFSVNLINDLEIINALITRINVIIKKGGNNE